MCLFLILGQHFEDEDLDLDDVLFLLDPLLLFSPLQLSWSPSDLLYLLFLSFPLFVISTMTLQHSMINLPVTLQTPPSYAPVPTHLSPMQHLQLAPLQAGLLPHKQAQPRV